MGNTDAYLVFIYIWTRVFRCIGIFICLGFSILAACFCITLSLFYYFIFDPSNIIYIRMFGMTRRWIDHSVQIIIRQGIRSFLINKYYIVDILRKLLKVLPKLNHVVVIIMVPRQYQYAFPVKPLQCSDHITYCLFTVTVDAVKQISGHDKNIAFLFVCNTHHFTKNTPPCLLQLALD